MDFQELKIGIVAFCFIILPIIFTIWNIVLLVKKKKSLKFEIVAFVIGVIFMCIAYYLLEPVYYTKALYINWGPSLHEALNRYHVVTIIILFSVGLIFYLILKYHKKPLTPLLNAVLLAGVNIGVIINVLVMIQLSATYKNGLEYIFDVLYMYLFLLNYFALQINLLIAIAKHKAIEQKEINYKNEFLQKCNLWLLKGANQFIGAVILMIPLLALLVLILTLFGQQPDSVIKAFIQTSDWILSTKISPPPIEYDAHYLCTVSLRGHKKLVKPTRYGIRHGKKIVVNRQLCVANAFEQLIMEKTPGFHKRLRNFYDTYGYPISKIIKKAWVADIVYLIMKPLEWIFLLVLYTFDEKPEDRIAKQYLPMQ